MRKLWLVVFIFVILMGISPLWGAEIEVYGSLSTPQKEFEAGISWFVDLGGHAFSVREWEKLVDGRSNLFFFPGENDLEEQKGFLQNRKEQVVVSDFYKKADSPYKPFGVRSENYHNFILLNFIGENLNLPWEDLQREIESKEPDALLVVGTSLNIETLKEKLSSLSYPVQFLEREKMGTDFVQRLVLPEKEVFLFFYSSRCPVCRKIKNEITPKVFAPYLDRIKVVYMDYTLTANYEELIRLEEFWKVEEKSSVEIFSAAGYVSSEDETKVGQLLEELIQKTLTMQGEKKKVIVPTEEARGLITSRFQGFTLWVLVGAGLLDGLNPCAFATIIFMVNLLLVLGHSRRRILEVGATYAVAVFVAYVLLGVGIFEVWRSLSVYQTISRIVYGVMAVFLIVLAILSLRDALWYRKTKKDTEMTLGLPQGWRVKINQYLKESFTKRGFFLAAVLSGFVISLVEAGCTGQVYLPTIMYIAREVSQYRLRALGYLLFYNVFFIVPLLVVFMGIFWGSQSKALVNFGRKNVLVTKFALAGLFFFLSFLLLEGALA